MTIIDAHHHFWDPDTGNFDWLSGPYAPLKRPFGPDDLRPSLAAAGVGATILVQTQADIEETRRFLALAETNDIIAGVVGWVDLCAGDVDGLLADLKAGPGGHRLVGIRHLVQDEPDPDWLLGEAPRRGLAAVVRHGLAYDLLLRPHNLPSALDTVAAFPDLRFVIDHLAKPDIKGGGFTRWANLMQPFARHRDHVWCKLSGMVTEADWQSWRPADLAPYVSRALSLFGPSRCLFGSDWPVCLVAGDYAQVFDALSQCLTGLGDADRQWVFEGSARALYRLEPKGDRA
ncbi:MAG: amidohydrolase family protein [Telmatospirillum sp.]|nr:amidohydrolase family protein [Telmatospirillum sp.]